MLESNYYVPEHLFEIDAAITNMRRCINAGYSAQKIDERETLINDIEKLKACEPTQ